MSSHVNFLGEYHVTGDKMPSRGHLP